MFAIFRKRDFSLMWSAQLVSTIGEALTDLAAAILIFRITNSAFAVGAVLMVTAIPTLFVGLFAGVFVDRFDKKRILLLANLLRGFIVLGIPLSYMTFIPSGQQDLFVISLYSLIFISATVRQFFDPAWEAVLPEIATEEELTHLVGGDGKATPIEVASSEIDFRTRTGSSSAKATKYVAASM